MAKYEDYPDMMSDNESSIDIKEILYYCLSKWYWIVISVVVCMAIGMYYARTMLPVYSRTAQIVLKTDAKSGKSELDNFSDISSFQSNSRLSNEIATLLSPDLMKGVVNQLNLQMNYSVPGRWHDEVLYGSNLPINVRLFGIAPTQTASLKVKLNPDSTVVLSDFKANGKEYGDKIIKGRLGLVFKTPIGQIGVQPTRYYSGSIAEPINVYCSTVAAATNKYKGELSVEPNEEKSSVVNLTVYDVSIDRAVDIINVLINEYNRKWIDDRNQIAVSTSNFINERLAVIESELGNVDTDISSFKSSNLLPDVAAASNIAMNQATAANAEIMQLNNQLYMANYVRQYLANSSKLQLLPANAGFETGAIESQIQQYNQMILDRNSLVANSNENNPIVRDMDRDLNDMRANILKSVDAQIETINAKIRTQERSQGEAITQIASNPQQAKYLLSVERQQKVKESLYLYLLQKREENELSQAFTAYNTRVIVSPTGSDAPTSPNTRNIYLISFLIGLVIPIAIIVLKSMLNSKVRGRKDIESLHAPFIGEIPLMTGKKIKSVKKIKSKYEPLVVVKEGSRNIINEAFRVVRANLEFMSGSRKVISVTSANPGSGKTFICYNLATAFALKGKKVLMIDLDLRRGSLSKYIGKKKLHGFTDYVVDRVSDINDAIYKDPITDGLYLLPKGTTPPNPTELLYSPRLKEILDTLRDEYDMIFIDCPPIEIVADTSIIDKQVDMTLFIIRAGLFERSMLNQIDKIYKQGTLKDLTIILNGTHITSKYGYSYGYQYGYSSGHYDGYTEK